MGTFGDRIRVLQAQTGDGQLAGKATVDQRYAEVQERDESLSHPRGGQARYLETATVARQDRRFRRIADSTLRDGIRTGMIDAVGDIADDVAVLAPLDENDLRRSAATTVVDAGAVVHSRPAAVPRLSDAQLREKSRRRSARGR